MSLRMVYRLKIGKIYLLILLAILAAHMANAEELDPALFTYKSTVTVSGYTGSSTLTDFPVLVKLADGAPTGFNYDDCASDGSDLRFADADGNLIPHEIESWTTDGTSYIWVKVPSLVGKTTTFTAYFGKNGASALPEVDAANVWSKYAVVVHGGSSLTNAVGNGLSVAAGSTAVTASMSAGIAGGGIAKSSNKSIGLNVANPSKSPSVLADAGKFSVSAWFRRNGNGGKNNNGTHILAAGRSGWNTEDGFAILQEVGTHISVSYKGGHNWTTGSGSLANQTWGHIAFAYDKPGALLTAYFNGGKYQEKTNPTTLVNTSRAYWTFGSFANAATDDSFKGDMDEIRVFNGVATADWIKAEYDSVYSPATFAVADAVSVVDASAPKLSAPVISRNDNGTFTITAVISDNEPVQGSVKCLVGESEFAMSTTSENLPATYSATISGLSDGTHTASVLAGSASGVDVTRACATAFHVGSLTVSGVTDADEETMSPGSFRISRADADATGLPALTFDVSFSGSGIDAIVAPGFSTLTIPAGEKHVEVVVAPVYTEAVDSDASLVLAVSGSNIGEASSGSIVIANATFDKAVRYVTTTGNDTNHGGTPELPKKTIASAISSLDAIAQSQSCTVYVAAGRYTISSRLELTQPIRIIGDDADPSSVVVSNKEGVAWGNTKHRCVTVNHAGALVSGITLENGKDYDDGGNVLIGENGGMVTNCIIRDGFTREGTSGGANVAIKGPGLLTHCMILGGVENNCSGCDRVSSVYLEHADARIENCLVRGFNGSNVASQPTVGCGGIIVNKGSAVNCTVVNCTSPYTEASGFAGILCWQGGRATNCVSVCNVDSNGTIRAFATSQIGRTSNCAFDAIAGETAIPEGMPNAVAGTTSDFFADYANGDYTPKTDGPLVNVGADYDGMASVDLAGKKRKVGKHIDIGCYECQKTPGLFIFVR